MFEEVKLISLSSVLIIPIIILFKDYISNKLKLWDIPNNDIKIHKNKISTIGGLIIFLSIILFYLIDYFTIKTEKPSFAIISSLLLTLFFITGLIDDKKNISPVKKTIITFALLLILIPLNNNLVLYELKFENLFNSSLNLNLASLFITVFFIYIFLNLLNFADGVNGVAISLGIFFIIVLGIERKEFLSSEIIVIITLLSLLFFNIQNKLFIGNSGCFVLGIFISLHYIYNYNLNNLILCDQIFIIFLIPGLDMTRLVVERLCRSKSILYGDLEHLHHILYKFFKQKYTWIIYILISIMPYASSFYIKKNIQIIILFSLIYLILIFTLRHRTFKG
jgi:UDP-GlcNAc:undecaprenyl-phosphate GlcNAc-1-phosphate transferase